MVQFPEELLAEFSNYGVKVVPISGDVSDFADAKRMVDQAIAELGSVDVFGQQCRDYPRYPDAQDDRSGFLKKCSR